MKAKELLKYRRLWMGLAMLWVMWYHFADAVYPRFSGFIGAIGYGGVDIFIFASGIGCYYSLNKDPDLLGFYKRRFLRIAPTYFCALLIWLLLRPIHVPLSVSAIVGNLLGIQIFTGPPQTFNWYIGAILLFYILSPLLKELADRLAGLGKQAAVLLVLAALTVPYWDNREQLIIMTRLPTFYLGMLSAAFCVKEKALKPQHDLALAAGVLAGLGLLYVSMQRAPQLLWARGLFWYPFILLTPGLCVGISRLAARLYRFSAVRLLLRPVEKIGQYSLEIFMAHVITIECFRALAQKLEIPAGNVGFWGAMLAVSLAGAGLLHGLLQLLRLLSARLQRRGPAPAPGSPGFPGKAGAVNYPGLTLRKREETGKR